MSSRSVNDLADQIDEVKIHTYHFTLWPRQWQGYTQSHGWDREKLERAKTNQIPESPGIYTLILQPGIAGHPSCSYLMYVGRTVSLRRRFREYLSRESLDIGRPRIFYFLKRYKGYIFFCYTVVTDDILPDMEKKLVDAYVPPLNQQYRGEIGRAMGAF
jgi:excinuclease UvrABC nuclease subunit